MTERQRVINPPDNYGRLYIKLLEGKLSSSAKLCYGVMWSFGLTSCWASNAAIAKRMGMSIRTVGSAQKELEDTGWIECTGRKNGLTKEWLMMTPATIAEEPKQPLPTPSATIAEEPKQPLPIKQEGKQELKQEKNNPIPLPHSNAPTGGEGDPEDAGEKSPRLSPITPVPPKNQRPPVDGFEDDAMQSGFYKAWCGIQEKSYSSPYKGDRKKDCRAIRKLRDLGFSYLEHLEILDNFFSQDPKVSWLFHNSKNRIDLETYSRNFTKYIPGKPKKAEAPISDAAMKIRKAFADLEESNDDKMQ